MSPHDFNLMVQSFGLAIGQIQDKAGSVQLKVPIEVNSQQAQQEMGRFLASTEGKPINLAMQADPSKAENAVRVVQLWAGTQEAKMLLDADPSKYAQVVDQLTAKAATDVTFRLNADNSNAARVLDNTLGFIEAQHPEIPLGADPTQANNIVAFWRAQASNQEAVAQLNANPAAAAAVTQWWQAWASSREGRAALNANPALAYAQLNTFINAALGRSTSVTVGADTSPAAAAVNAFLAQHRWMTLGVNVQFGSRWGNVFPMAVGGVSSYAAAGIGSGGPLYKWAEPETGGEAFIPRLGDEMRSKKILDIAASWYGMSVVPISALRAAPAAAGRSVSVVVAPGAVVIQGNADAGVVDRALDRFAANLTRSIDKGVGVGVG
jgi:hypothetical protein